MNIANLSTLFHETCQIKMKCLLRSCCGQSWNVETIVTLYKVHWYKTVLLRLMHDQINANDQKCKTQTQGRHVLVTLWHCLDHHTAFSVYICHLSSWPVPVYSRIMSTHPWLIFINLSQREEHKGSNHRGSNTEVTDQSWWVWSRAPSGGWECSVLQEAKL